MQFAMKLWPSIGPLTLLSALALVGCEDDRAGREPARETPVTPASPGAATPTSPAATPTSVEAVKEAPERFYGKVVTVAGKIDEVYGDRAVELEGAGWAFNDNITVITKTPVNLAGAALAAGDEVIVTGTVRPFVVTEVEREVGWDIGPDVEIRMTKRPVLVATSVSKVGEYARWTATGTAGATEPITSALAILTASDPGMLAGRAVDLPRERVQSVTGKGMWIGPSPMSQAFVLPTDAVKDVKQGDLVHVKGTLRKAPKDAAKAWGLPTNMEGAVNDRMVFIDAATAVKAPPGTTGAGQHGTTDAGATDAGTKR